MLLRVSSKGKPLFPTPSSLQLFPCSSSTMSKWQSKNSTPIMSDSRWENILTFQVKCILPLTRKTIVVILSSCQICECAQKKKKSLSPLPSMPTLWFSAIITIFKVPCIWSFLQDQKFSWLQPQNKLSILGRDVLGPSHSPVVLSKHCPRTSSISVTRDLVRNATAWDLAQTSWIKNSGDEAKICVLTSLLGDSEAAQCLEKSVSKSLRL